jgi:hypothetical protein
MKCAGYFAEQAAASMVGTGLYLVGGTTALGWWLIVWGTVGLLAAMVAEG